MLSSRATYVILLPVCHWRGWKPVTHHTTFLYPHFPCGTCGVPTLGFKPWILLTGSSTLLDYPVPITLAASTLRVKMNKPLCFVLQILIRYTISKGSFGEQYCVHQRTPPLFLLPSFSSPTPHLIPSSSTLPHLISSPPSPSPSPLRLLSSSPSPPPPLLPLVQILNHWDQVCWLTWSLTMREDHFEAHCPHASRPAKASTTYVVSPGISSR